MHIEIRREAASPGATVPTLSQQIADQIRATVAAGELLSGDRLPPVRDLAHRLGVNRDTVVAAYERLAAEGLVEATVGRGTFVRAGQALAAAADRQAPRLAPTVERLLAFERARPGYGPTNGGVPLHSLVPDPTLYPVKSFRRSLNRVLEATGTELLTYGGHQGHLGLRQVIAGRLRAHGIETEPDNLVLCQGASQGISLALRLYAEPGDHVAVEEPTYHNVLAALTALGLRPAPIPMTADGPDLDALERTLARPEVKLFYTMPSFHNPLGSTTSLAHRRALLDIAVRAWKPVVEDAFEMDLRFDGRPVSPLAALDRSGLVVHLFSFSKSLFPGARAGAITATGRAVDALRSLKSATDLSGVLMLQAAVADFVEHGGYDRHLARIRKTLRCRRDALLEALAEYLPEAAVWARPEGGYQLWLELPADVDTRSLLSDAQQAGVLFSPGYQFHHDGRPSRGLRLTTALADVDEIRRGVTLLGDVVRAHRAQAVRLQDMDSVHV